jgi:small subunit ribosomal protein S9
MTVTFFEGVGRRKESTARVRIQTGNGIFTVNDKELVTYFPRTGDSQAILAALAATGIDPHTVDVTAHVNGGGVTGQTDAVKLGLARALTKWNHDHTPALRKIGYLTRDARVKERKKPGLKRARKAPTYTKR